MTKKRKTNYKKSLIVTPGLEPLGVRLLDCKKSKKDGNDQESIQSSATPDPGYHMRMCKIHN